ncbi:MAG: hypothetical protein AAFP86_04460 [Planctomycetota bacterium]
MRTRPGAVLLLALPLALPAARALVGPASAPAAQTGQQTGAGQPLPLDDLPGELPPPTAGDPVGGETRRPDSFDIFGRRRVRRGDTVEERIRGGWQLTELFLPESDARGRIAQGFMNIGDGLLSMELHAAWEQEGENAEFAEFDLHTTFTAEFQLTGNRELRCSTVIGSYLDEETGELLWERTGFERLYRLRENAGLLEFSFGPADSPQGKLIWKPYVPSREGEVDIFGRKQVVTGAFGDVDIFGREVETPRGVEDIYGRTRPEEGVGEGGETPAAGDETPAGGEGPDGGPDGGGVR